MSTRNWTKMPAKMNSSWYPKLRNFESCWMKDDKEGIPFKTPLEAENEMVKILNQSPDLINHITPTEIVPYNDGWVIRVIVKSPSLLGSQDASEENGSQDASEEKQED